MNPTEIAANNDSFIKVAIIPLIILIAIFVWLRRRNGLNLQTASEKMLDVATASQSDGINAIGQRRRAWFIIFSDLTILSIGYLFNRLWGVHLSGYLIGTVLLTLSFALVQLGSSSVRPK